MDKRSSSQSINKHESQYRTVDNALRSYPLQPAPPDLLPEVMRRIQSRQTAAWYSPRRGWVYALGFSILISVIMAWRIWSLLPMDWTARAQFRLLMWQYNLNYLLPQYGMMVGMVLMLAGLGLLAGMVWWRSGQRFFVSQKLNLTNLF